MLLDVGSSLLLITIAKLFFGIVRDAAGFGALRPSPAASQFRLFYRRKLPPAAFRGSPRLSAGGPRLALFAGSGRLTLRTEVAAAASNNDSLDRRAATV